jgi:addiction module HigA family antidote
MLGRQASTPMLSITRTITDGAGDAYAQPPHPGEIIRALCLEPLGVSVTQAAEALGVSRKTLSAILNGRAGISPEMAVRLSIAFGTSSEAGTLGRNRRRGGVAAILQCRDPAIQWAGMGRLATAARRGIEGCPRGAIRDVPR